MITIVICCYRCWMLIVISSINMLLAYIYIYIHTVLVYYIHYVYYVYYGYWCCYHHYYYIYIVWNMTYTVESEMDSLRHVATTRRVQRSSPSDERSAAECHRSAPMLVVSVEPAGAGRTSWWKKKADSAWFSRILQRTWWNKGAPHFVSNRHQDRISWLWFLPWSNNVTDQMVTQLAKQSDPDTGATWQ